MENVHARVNRTLLYCAQRKRLAVELTRSATLVTSFLTAGLHSDDDETVGK